jgi:pyrroloquinoline quinone biosynthesis protein E
MVDKMGNRPLRSLAFPEMMNMELTDRCPLKCPQCYCQLNAGRDLDFEIAKKNIDNAARLNISYINLSGGETLLYPFIVELVAYISSKGLYPALAISGWGLDKALLKQLIEAGVHSIYVSLNGSQETINALSRDGYPLAIEALKLLQASEFDNYFINWVARNDNILDFLDLCHLASQFRVKGLVVIASKPDSQEAMQSLIDKENILILAEEIRRQDQVDIWVESCFSELKAHLGKGFFFNTNRGIKKGCGAGRDGMSITVEGYMTPCRHINYPEKFQTIEEYWYQSDFLHQLRQYEDHKEDPCKSCRLSDNCFPCRAVALKVEKNIFSANKYCQLRE